MLTKGALTRICPTGTALTLHVSDPISLLFPMAPRLTWALRLRALGMGVGGAIPVLSPVRCLELHSAMSL